MPQEMNTVQPESQEEPRTKHQALRSFRSLSSNQNPRNFCLRTELFPPANRMVHLKLIIKLGRETLPMTRFLRPILYQIVICILISCCVVKLRHGILLVSFA